MPAKSKNKMRQSHSSSNHRGFWGFTTESLLLKAMSLPRPPVGNGRTASVTVDSQRKSDTPVRMIEGQDLVDVRLHPLSHKELETDRNLQASAWVRVRDTVGASLQGLEKLEVKVVTIDLQLDDDLIEAAVVGLEIALYRFKRTIQGGAQEGPVSLAIRLLKRGREMPAKQVEAACHLGIAVNLARHLVNLPPNILNPVAYAEAVLAQAKDWPATSCEVWDEKKIQAERMQLLWSVGKGSQTPPRFVHLSYRPSPKARSSSLGTSPVAFVGKGITFDSGGLDMKNSSGMRLMKKDMGGSAAVLAVAWWVAKTRCKTPCDFYLAMAENAVDGASYRPSDVLTARNGSTVEIHNTDAEGRLVMADAMDVAITQDPAPRYMIDVATLTGAIKVALGASIAGLFSNDAHLAAAIQNSGRKVGDFSWIMPLVQRYRSQLNSTFADQINSADGFGGSITAALFLEKFAGAVPWAHLDIYAWRDSTEGAWFEPGGSGQGVLALTNWLASLK